LLDQNDWEKMNHLSKAINKCLPPKVVNWLSQKNKMIEKKLDHWLGAENKILDTKRIYFLKRKKWLKKDLNGLKSLSTELKNAYVQNVLIFQSDWKKVGPFVNSWI
jgi:hypothetical protein